MRFDCSISNQVAIEVVAVLAERDLERNAVVGPVGLGLAQVERHARRAQERPGDAPRDGVLFRERAHPDHPVHEDPVAGDEGVHFFQDLARLRERLLDLEVEPGRQIGFHPAHAPVGDGQPRPGDVLHQLPQELAGLDHVEEDGEGPQLHGPRAHAGEVVADPGDLAHDHPDVLASLGDLDAEQLLHHRAVAEVVDERGDVVEPVGVGDRVVVRARLAVLLEGPVQVADLHVGLHHRLAVKLREDAHDAVHRGMSRPDVDVEVLAALATSAPLAQEQLARVGH
jgi:hypothetical protein